MGRRALSPQKGAELVVLSTGIAVDESGAGFTPPQPGTDFGKTAPNPFPEAIACVPGSLPDTTTVNDLTELRLMLLG